MIVKLFLFTGFGVVLLYAFLQYRRSRLISAVMMLTSVAGSVMVTFPELTSILANWAGVGRGADLVLYCFVLIALVAIFNLHLRLRSTQETSTELARSIALMTAKYPSVQTIPGEPPELQIE